METISFRIRKHTALHVLLGALSLAPFAAQAQAHMAATSSMMTTAALPDAPGMMPERDGSSSSLESGVDADMQSSASFTTGGRHAMPDMASPTEKYIEPGQAAPPLGPGDKVVLGIKDAFSPLSFVGWAAAAGYQQAMNGSPNYGTNAVAFGKRFGASAARATSDGVFTDSIMAPLLREDPRYYRMGPGHNAFARLGYALTRTLVTRTDSGRVTPNFALLAGNLGGSFLTKTYYPALNQSNSEVLKTFGGSVGGSAIGFAVSEFFSDTFSSLSFHKSH